MNESWEIPSFSPERTRQIGELLGAVLEAGDVVVLDGPLGAGKTTLAQGIARGLGIDEQVTSPTFVVARELPAGRRGHRMLHVDAYRISSLPEWDDLDLDLESAVAVVEWGQRVADGLPLDRLHVRIAGEDDVRSLCMTASGPRSDRVMTAVRTRSQAPR